MPRTSFARVALALIVCATLAACGGDDDDDAASGNEIEGVQTYDRLTNGHTTDPVDYPQSPPVGGDHDPFWQNCGVYRDPVRNENAVHSLEHGAVSISYSEDLPEADVAALEALATGQSHILVAPYPGLSSPIVLTAWGRQLAVDAADDPRIEQFVEAFQEGPQAPEQGSSCDGALGEPIDV
jgi:Protein of unknown function (DUF3105)